LLQDQLIADDYTNLMNYELEDLACHWLRALENIDASKIRVAEIYGKELKIKEFRKNCFGS
jgi:hypothetical protein